MKQNENNQNNRRKVLTEHLVQVSPRRRRRRSSSSFVDITSFFCFVFFNFLVWSSALFILSLVMKTTGYSSSLFAGNFTNTEALPAEIHAVNLI